MAIFIIITLALIYANIQHEKEKFSVVKNVDVYGSRKPKKHNNIWKKFERGIQVSFVIGFVIHNLSEQIWNFNDALFFTAWATSFHLGFFDGLLNVGRTGDIKHFFKTSYKDNNKIIDFVGIFLFLVLTFFHLKNTI